MGVRARTHSYWDSRHSRDISQALNWLSSAQTNMKTGGTGYPVIQPTFEKCTCQIHYHSDMLSLWTTACMVLAMGCSSAVLQWHSRHRRERGTKLSTRNTRICHTYMTSLRHTRPNSLCGSTFHAVSPVGKQQSVPITYSEWHKRGKRKKGTRRLRLSRMEH